MSRFGDLVGGKSTPTPTPAPVVKEVPSKKEPNLSEMSKKELESYGRTVGVELDRRHSKKDLVKELKDII